MPDEVSSFVPEGPKPEIPETQTVPAQGDVEDLPPELQDEMDRVMAGEPEAEPQQREDSSPPQPSPVSQGGSRDEELAGDEPA
ncbi:MAG: hypothetical protein ACYC1D_14720, partial [Acidimicrobiales bacterium]